MSYLSFKKLAILALVLVFSDLSHAEVCSKGPSDLASNTQVQALINGVQGGLDGLLGRWKLGGIEGTFYNLSISLTATDDQYFIQSNSDALPKQIYLCTEDSDSAALQIQVLTPKKPENRKFLVKPRNAGSISVAAHGSGWSYKKFNRK